jgi:galactonate dehydratase
MPGDMIIKQIETVRSPAHPNLLWVHVKTSDGLTGLGETFYIPTAVESIIHDFAAPLLLNKSAIDRERHWNTLFSYINFFGHGGAEMRALSALDIALWDLAGQYLKQPVCNLLGGRTRDSIAVYNTCVNTPKYADQDGFLKKPGELAQSLLSMGIRQMKVWPWDQFAPQIEALTSTGPAGWSAVGPVGHALTPEQLEKGLWTVSEIRKAVGSKMNIAIEGHSRWDLNCAIRIARAVEKYDVIWMEDIIQPTNPDDLGRLTRETRVPQTVSERLFTRHAFRQVLESKAAHMVMPDIVWTGGITETMKIASLADTYHLPIAPHDCTGPIALAASLHVCAAVSNAMIMESVRGFLEGSYLEIVDKPLPIREGRAILDFSPGLGFKLRKELLDGAVVRTSPG